MQVMKFYFPIPRATMTLFMYSNERHRASPSLYTLHVAGRGRAGVGAVMERD